LRQRAIRNGGDYFNDAANLLRQVGGHDVDVVGEIFPGAGHTWYLGLAAELTDGSDFAGHARYLSGKRVELVDHRVDGVFQLKDFALNIDRDLAR